MNKNLAIKELVHQCRLDDPDPHRLVDQVLTVAALDDAPYVVRPTEHGLRIILDTGITIDVTFIATEQQMQRLDEEYDGWWVAGKLRPIEREDIARCAEASLTVEEPSAHKPKRLKGADIRQRAWGKIAEHHHNNKRFTSLRELARAVECSHGGDTIRKVWNWYERTLAADQRTPKAEPLHEGIGRRDEELEKLLRDQATDAKTDDGTPVKKRV